MKNQRSVGGVNGPQFIRFVSESDITRGKQLNTAAGELLVISYDWQMRADVDVNRQLAFPQHISVTNRRPDIVLWSQTKIKKISLVLIELTAPYEEKVDKAHERKTQKLVEHC